VPAKLKPAANARVENARHARAQEIFARCGRGFFVARVTNDYDNPSGQKVQRASDTRAAGESSRPRVFGFALNNEGG